MVIKFITQGESYKTIEYSGMPGINGLRIVTKGRNFELQVIKKQPIEICNGG